MKTYFIIIALVATLFAASCGENKEGYKKRSSIAIDSMESVSEAMLKLSSERTSAWRSSIYDHTYNGRYCSDFSEALSYFNKDNEQAIERIKNGKSKIDSLFASVKEHPNNTDELYSKIKGLYTLYCTCYDFAVNPSGSLLTYSDLVNKTGQDYKKIKTEIDIERK